VEGARRVIAELGRAGLDIPATLARLKNEALQAFVDSFAALMLGIDTKRKAALLRGRYEIAGAGLGKELDRFNIDLQLRGFAPGLWAKQATLWSDEPEEQKRIGNRLGWLESPELMAKNLPRLLAFAEAVRRDGIQHVVLLGMGGSSLAPEVMRAVLGGAPGAPVFTMLDSTDPAAVRAVDRKVEISRTLFIVASKSGTTIEPNALCAFFKFRLLAAGVKEYGRHLAAITDEGTALHELAQQERYREIFLNPSDIGGRYSALSFFGMVPAAIMGLDVSGLLGWGRGMASLCGPTNAIGQNPGVALGIVLGSAARSGRDKLTLITGPRLRPFGLWIEQLIAESTGKRGTGIVPVAGEPLGIGAEFVRWEVATATAGAVLGINPFDEPNVQQAKDATKALLKEYTNTGRLPIPSPYASADGLRLTFTRPALDKMGSPAGAAAAVRAFLDLVQAGDYLGVLAYLPGEPAIEARLERLRHELRD